MKFPGLESTTLEEDVFCSFAQSSTHTHTHERGVLESARIGLVLGLLCFFLSYIGPFCLS